MVSDDVLVEDIPPEDALPKYDVRVRFGGMQVIESEDVRIVDLDAGDDDQEEEGVPIEIRVLCECSKWSHLTIGVALRCKGCGNWRT